jgi:elongation factor G
MTFPEPVIQVAIEPKTKADQEKLGGAIQKLAEEDPTFQVHTDEETGQTDHRRHGRAPPRHPRRPHAREFKVEANVGKPQVAYRETIKRSVEKYDYTHKKQTGGSGQFAKVQIALEPPTRPRGALRVRQQGHRWSHPARVHPVGRPRHPGRHAVRRAGRLPARRDIKATLLDGAYHDVDSSEMAFKIAGSMAFKEAARKADPVLLEPMMAVEVAPRGLHGRRHRRHQLPPWPHPGHGGHRGNAKVVRGLVPLSEMFGYVGDLRSKTQGRANYSMEFDSYAEVPKSVAEEIIKKTRGE